jgi:hypothetical protein
MTLNLFIALFAVNMVFVLCKSFQQKSVMHDKKLWILPVSLLMSACEVFMVGSIAILVVASQSYWAFIPAGCGAAVGCLLGMELFNRLNKDTE